MVEEPSVEETIVILEGLRPRYEAHHHVAIEHEAVEAAAKLSQRYISDRFLPDKAIDLLDEAGSRVRMQAFHAETRQEEAQPKKERSLAEEQQILKQIQQEKKVLSCGAIWTKRPSSVRNKEHKSGLSMS